MQVDDLISSCQLLEGGLMSCNKSQQAIKRLAIMGQLMEQDGINYMLFTAHQLIKVRLCNNWYGYAWQIMPILGQIIPPYRQNCSVWQIFQISPPNQHHCIHHHLCDQATQIPPLQWHHYQLVQLAMLFILQLQLTRR